FDGQAGREFLDARLTLIAKVDRRTGRVNFKAADLRIELGDRGEQLVDLTHVGRDLDIEVGLNLGDTGIRLLEAVGEERPLLNQGLALPGVGWTGGEALEGVEEIIDRTRETGRASRSGVTGGG